MTNYQHNAGYARHSDTSLQAAKTIEKVRGGLLRDVFDHFYTVPNYGFTVDEMKVEMERLHNREYDRSTIAARFTELKAIGLIRLNGEKRKMAGRKCFSGVHVLKGVSKIDSVTISVDGNYSKINGIS